MKNNAIVYVLALLCVVGGYFLGQHFKECPEQVGEEIVIRDTLIVQDTVFIERIKPEIRYVDVTIYERDTVYVERNVRVASADTTIDSVGYFRAEYYFPPANYFNLFVHPAPRRERTITLTKYIEVPPPWYEKPLWGLAGFGLGLGTGVILK